MKILESICEFIITAIGFIIGLIVLLPISILFIALIVICLPFLLLSLPFIGTMCLIDYFDSEKRELRNKLNKLLEK